jgi:fluoride ion exporter CrcB/FEX
MSAMIIVAVAVGGAVGSVARLLIGMAIESLAAFGSRSGRS